jgi:hypothetical protein
MSKNSASKRSASTSFAALREVRWSHACCGTPMRHSEERRGRDRQSRPRRLRQKRAGVLAPGTRSDMPITAIGADAPRVSCPPIGRE